MEAEPEDSDVRRDDRFTLLWEKCFRQSIVVDLSEDESLLVSDLDTSVALRLSRAESEASEDSVHLAGSAELSAPGDSSDRTTSQKVKQTTGSVCHVSGPRPNAMEDRTPDSTQGNTSDEDQEDLPYDGTPGSSSFSQTAGSEGNVSAEGPSPLREREDVEPREAGPGGPADIHQVLLRHFSQEEFLRSGGPIETETLPEVSLLDSVDDTVRSSPTRHAGAGRAVDGDARSEAQNPTVAAASSVTSGLAGPDTTQNRAEAHAEEVKQIQRAPLIRTTSFSEMKYGQGQVHYPLPDFSKVQSKVRFPRAPPGPVRPAPQNPGFILRAQSSPNMLAVIGRVLEDSAEPPEKPYVFKDDEALTPAALVLHLQDGSLPGLERGGADRVPESHARRPAPSEKHAAAPATPRCRDPSDGERMTSDLRDVVSRFMHKVEEFKVKVTRTNGRDQQKMLGSLMEVQDQLERNYISRKEEHRALEMQKHMGLCRNTGCFDPNRLVEGDIFRMGMHLEDIKEMIDRNVCEHISVCQSSSTPEVTMPQGKCGALYLESPAPPLCQVPQHCHIPPFTLSQE